MKYLFTLKKQKQKTKNSQPGAAVSALKMFLIDLSDHICGREYDPSYLRAQWKVNLVEEFVQILAPTRG